MTTYKVDVIGEQNLDKSFDNVMDAFDYGRDLLENGKKVEVSALPNMPTEAPNEGEGAPKNTDTMDTDETDEPATDPKDADIDATDEDDDDGELSGEELDAADDEDSNFDE